MFALFSGLILTGCNVEDIPTATKKELVSIQVTPSALKTTGATSITVVAGLTQPFTATGAYSDKSQENISQSVSWQSMIVRSINLDQLTQAISTLTWKMQINKNTVISGVTFACAAVHMIGMENKQTCPVQALNNFLPAPHSRGTPQMLYLWLNDYRFIPAFAGSTLKTLLRLKHSSLNVAQKAC